MSYIKKGLFIQINNRRKEPRKGGDRFDDLVCYTDLKNWQHGENSSPEPILRAKSFLTLIIPLKTLTYDVQKRLSQRVNFLNLRTELLIQLMYNAFQIIALHNWQCSICATEHNGHNDVIISIGTVHYSWLTAGPISLH